MIKQAIAEMLTENTGIHMLDSGGDNGRMWQRNQAATAAGFTFEDQEHTSIEFGWYGRDKPELEIMRTVSVYHWLTERLEVPGSDCPVMELWNQFLIEAADRDDAWLAEMEAFMDYLTDHGWEPTGIYGDGNPVTVNTYNHSSPLSQTLQFIYFNTDHGEFVLLQIHGGCDVRGGYTKPRLFRCNGNYELPMFFDQDGSIYCTGEGGNNLTEVSCGASWWTDDNWHWYASDNCEDLASYELVIVDNSRDLLLKRGRIGGGKLVIDERTNKAYCPHCGSELGA
jgi:hypothetical protein